jgi:hypothetical protein
MIEFQGVQKPLEIQRQKSAVLRGFCGGIITCPKRLVFGHLFSWLNQRHKNQTIQFRFK